MVLANVVELLVVVEAGVLTLVVVWLVVPVVLGCSEVVLETGVVASVEVVCTTLVVGATPETLIFENKIRYVGHVANKNQSDYRFYSNITQSFKVAHNGDI